jgi:hypothetical protein
MDWKGALLRAAGYHLRQLQMSGELEDILQSLEPLSMPQAERYLLIQCENGWTAYFDNHRIGTDLGGPLTVLSERAACDAVRICEQGVTRKDGTRRSDAVIFELRRVVSGKSITARAVELVKEGTWGWFTYGTPLSFEDVERYSEKRVADRFTLEMLERYANALGIKPFAPEFYLSRSPGNVHVVQVTNVEDPRQTRSTLREVQLKVGRRTTL